MLPLPLHRMLDIYQLQSVQPEHSTDGVFLMGPHAPLHRCMGSAAWRLRSAAQQHTLSLFAFLFVLRFLHLRAAADDFLDIVSRHVSDMPRGGVVHSFDGSAEEAARILQHQQLAIGALYG